MASNSDPTSSSAQTALQKRKVIHEGYLKVRGKLRIYSNRYLILNSDGSLQHFEKPPGLILTTPLKTINVKNGEFLPSKDPRPYSLHIRNRQVDKIEHVYAADTEDLRDTWCSRFKEEFSRRTDTDTDTVAPQVSPLSTVSKTGLYGCKRKAKLDDFTYLNVLGSGSFAKVILVRCRELKKVYAMKMICRNPPPPKKYRPPKTESCILFMCRHPFLSSMVYSFNTKEHHCFVMDFGIGGDLRFHLEKSNNGFSIDRTRFYAAEIACGLGYLHSNHIIYRDLKLENVLLDKEGHVKIADFGLCKENKPHGARTKTFCGTPEYMAPEVLCMNSYDHAVDWWSLGIVVFEMLFKRFPHADMVPTTEEDLLKYSEPDFPEWPPIDEDTENFIKSLLHQKPSKRLGGSSRDVEDVKKHAFFKGIIDWTKLEERKMEPPFKPQINGEDDMKYFDINHLLGENKDTAIDFKLHAKPIELYKTKSLNDIWAQFSYHENRNKTAEDTVEDTEELDKP